MTVPPRVVRVAVPVPLHRTFDYSIPPGLPTPVPGARVRVPFAGRKLIGVVVAADPEDAHASLKPVTEVLDDESVLGEELTALSRWLASYYLHPLGEVIATLLPAAARKGAALTAGRREFFQATAHAPDLRRAPRQRELFDLIAAAGGRLSMEAIREAGFARSHVSALAAKGLVVRVEEDCAPAPLPPPAPARVAEPALELTDEQATALEALEPDGYAAYVLNGITGSGKTEVYLRFIERILDLGRQVLVLVPEIALTPQTVGRFRSRFGEAEVMHSNMTDQARLQTWLSIRAGRGRILIGTRSAVLTPFHDLGLIVVDEEHDSSFKQMDGLRYSARDVAVKRARDLDIPLILGSATPSFETLNNAFTGRYRHLRLTRRATGASLPDFHVVDIRGHTLDGGLSLPLLRAVEETVAAGGQALIFLNRRGFAPSLVCPGCGWQGRCGGCEWPMTVHSRPPRLICHHCGRRERSPENCPQCGRDSLVAVGAGTQRCEQVLADRFPEIPVYRIDRDTTRSQKRLEERLAAIGGGAPAILVGTQMLAKGHHFPDVTLVGVINADGGFTSPDFRAPERTAQLIVQVAGRAGRAERPGRVLVQTYQPENPLLTTLLEEGYLEFARQELETRRASELPPARPMALLRAESTDGDRAQGWLRTMAGVLSQALEVYGPAPALMPRVADRIRYQLMILAADRPTLHRGLTPLTEPGDVPRDVRWSLDVDPYDTA